MPEMIRRYRMITLRLFGQHEHRVDHNSSVSFGCSSENCKTKLHVTATICLYFYERKNKKRITPRSCSSHSRWEKVMTRKIWSKRHRNNIYIYIYIYTGCPRRNEKYFGRVFLMLNYADITQNTYIQSWTVTELMAIEKCVLLWCPRTVRRPWRNIHPLRKLGKAISSCSDLDERFISR